MKDRLVLQNVTLLNDEKADIIIANGEIADVSLPGTGHGDRIIDSSHAYVSPGWIDMHVHAFPEFEPYGDDIDEIGVKQGVTTIVDAGSCGADRIKELIHSGEQAKTNLRAFLNISRIGLQRVDELSNMMWIDKAAAVKAVNAYPDVIVGLKARISSSVVCGNGIEPLLMAQDLSDETNMPLMVHIGSAPPDIEDVIPILKKHDIITHYLNGKENNLFDDNGEPLPVLLQAINRGVHLDVGHGTASFSFKIAEAAKRHNISPDTISTDIYRGNRLNGPVYSMANVLSKFLYLGYPLEDVIAAVTSRPAEWLNKPALGRIKQGDPANLTLFTLCDGPAVLTDSAGDQRTADRTIEAIGVVINGEFIKC